MQVKVTSADLTNLFWSFIYLYSNLFSKWGNLKKKKLLHKRGGGGGGGQVHRGRIGIGASCSASIKHLTSSHIHVSTGI